MHVLCIELGAFVLILRARIVPVCVHPTKRDPPLHRQLKIQNRDTDPKIGVNNRKAQRKPKHAR